MYTKERYSVVKKNVIIKFKGEWVGRKADILCKETKSEKEKSCTLKQIAKIFITCPVAIVVVNVYMFAGDGGSTFIGELGKHINAF